MNKSIHISYSKENCTLALVKTNVWFINCQLTIAQSLCIVVFESELQVILENGLQTSNILLHDNMDFSQINNYLQKTVFLENRLKKN